MRNYENEVAAEGISFAADLCYEKTKETQV